MTSMGGQMASQTPAGAVWTKACLALRSELGEAAFGSWLAQAALREVTGGQLVLVTPTGVARDWIRRNAWRRIGELWAQHDPEGRSLDLKSRMEFESESGGIEIIAEAIEVMDPVATDAPTIAPLAPGRPSRTAGLQERFTFDSFVPGPANEFAHAVARRVASWTDGHFNPVLFHGPYGFGKTHLLNALAWEAIRNAPGKRVVYLTAERFTTTFVRALQDKQTQAFKEELRNADLLLVDDVHFVAGKPSTQEELFHTLIALITTRRPFADRAFGNGAAPALA